VGVLGLPLKARAVAREASGGKPRRAARGSKVQLRRRRGSRMPRMTGRYRHGPGPWPSASGERAHRPRLRRCRCGCF
jgi:hypothetical protein